MSEDIDRKVVAVETYENKNKEDVWIRAEMRIFCEGEGDNKVFIIEVVDRDRAIWLHNEFDKKPMVYLKNLKFARLGGYRKLERNGVTYTYREVYLNSEEDISVSIKWRSALEEAMRTTQFPDR